jgi:hypothetical protein
MDIGAFGSADARTHDSTSIGISEKKRMFDPLKKR